MRALIFAFAALMLVGGATVNAGPMDGGSRTGMETVTGN